MKKNIIILILISSLISNTYILLENFKYQKFYKEQPKEIEGKAIILDKMEEKEYSYCYIIKVKSGEYKNKKFIYYLSKTSKIGLEAGDLFSFKGEYILPSESRNYKGFNYRQYLKTSKIYGTIKNKSKIQIIAKNKSNCILRFSYKARNLIETKIKKILPGEEGDLLIGILIGNKNYISEEIIENFKLSNLSHMLAVSGAHTSYVILGLSYILNKSKISKKWVYILNIIILIIFMCITNFTSSVVRACIMAILLIGAKIFYCKSDSITNISISLLIILILNPFDILEIGFQLSYLGTLGIILFNKKYEELFLKLKMNSKIAKLLSVTFSAQTMILPIMISKFNSISLTFFISNLLASPMLGIIIILGFINVLISFISFDLAKILAVILKAVLKILILITKIVSKLPFSNIIVKTPYTITIISLYLIILIFHFFNLRKLLKVIKLRYKKVLLILISTIIFINLICSLNVSKSLKIYFIDVGQGDSCLIKTPKGKTILIDGGEGKTDVLFKYLLARRIKKIDYIMISHFDSDHCNGLLDVINKLKVKNIIISKQVELNEEYINIAKAINNKKINVIFVKQGQILQIEKNLQLDILYPKEVLEYDDLNNNSIVAKLKYNNFSILFCGDIEKSEENIINLYGKELKSTILKVAHHGSKTSSSEEFLQLVKPQIALIGVGENNKFGHPNSTTIDKLKVCGTLVLRTDINGEIDIKVNEKGKIWINKMIN